MPRMSSTTRNRGKQSSDDQHFALKWHPIFKNAVDDMCHLLTRGYAVNSTLLLVGNRYKLNKRQRNAILRVSCSDQEANLRRESECLEMDLKNDIVEIDGFNLLILLESALSGALVFKGRDGLYRDISSVHGSYKRVMKTEKAIVMIGDVLKSMNIQSVKWYLDSPVSNSGKLKSQLLEVSRINNFNWEVELVFDPDKVLAKSDNVVISSDGWILDNAKRWFNLGSFLIDNNMENATIIEM